MERIYKYLKKCGVYFLATCDEVDERQPRVRPFGTIIREPLEIADQHQIFEFRRHFFEKS